MPPATTFVWKYFKRCADDNEVKCSLCGNELSWTGGTSNMRNHIRIKQWKFIVYESIRLTG